MLSLRLVVCFLLCLHVQSTWTQWKDTEGSNSTELLVQSMLIELNQMHQDLFTNFSAIWRFSEFFVENGTWWMPVGLHRPGDLRVGPAAILKSLQDYTSLLAGERSWMNDISVCGSSGAYWWRDVYSRADGCMFTSLGYNQFFIDPATGLMSVQNTWMDMLDGYAQGVACGMHPEPFHVQYHMAHVYNQVMDVLSNKSSELAAKFPSMFASDGLFWEPVGLASGRVEGQQAISQMWQGALGSLESWTHVVIHDPLFAGNSVGVDVVLSFVTPSGCVYSIREFISILVDKEGLISNFSVYYDRAAASAARAKCRM